MKCDICYKEKFDEALVYCLNKLPFILKSKLIDYFEKYPYKSINEIRLHKNAYIMLIADSKNVKTDIYLTEDDINDVYESICDYSLYAHINTIKHGYISIGCGIRAGICGRAIIENGEINGISDISSINFRIPQHIENASKYLFNFLKNNNFDKSVIIYSPPGVGKTTILRDLIYKLSNNANIRYAVIDTRAEITPCIKHTENGDFFVSYPKGTAIELATKSMTPQLIICDEISSMEEAKEILHSANAGVKLIATTHAYNFKELLSKEIFKNLINNGVFDYALGVSREYGDKKYEFTLNSLK